MPSQGPLFGAELSGRVDFRRLASHLVATYLPDNKDLGAEQALLNHRVYAAERPVLVRLLDQLHSADSNDELIGLHRELLRRIRERQNLIAGLRRRQRDARERISTLAKQRPKPVPELAREDHYLAGAKHLEQVQLALQFQLRSVGDGLALKALGYDRRAITVIGRGERVAWLSDSEGWRAEVAVLERFWSRGELAIHNDMTNCLRHGDVTVVSPARRTVELYEVKAGSKEDQRQTKRMEEVVATLGQGWHPTAANGAPLHLKEAKCSYDTALRELPALFERARVEGVGWATLWDGVLVRVIDVSWAGNADAFQAKQDEIRASVPWYGEAESNIDFFSAFRRMRDRRHSFSSLAPFSIFPLAAGDLADLMMGYLELATTLNGPRIERAFRPAGITARVELGDQRFRKFADVERGRCKLEIPAHVREQMFLELVSPGAVVAAASELLDDLGDRPTTGDDARLLTFAREFEAWARAA